MVVFPRLCKLEQKDEHGRAKQQQQQQQHQPTSTRTTANRTQNGAHTRAQGKSCEFSGSWWVQSSFGKMPCSAHSQSEYYYVYTEMNTTATATTTTGTRTRKPRKREEKPRRWKVAKSQSSSSSRLCRVSTFFCRCHLDVVPSSRPATTTTTATTRPGRCSRSLLS